MKAFYFPLILLVNCDVFVLSETQSDVADSWSIQKQSSILDISVEFHTDSLMVSLAMLLVFICGHALLGK